MTWSVGEKFVWLKPTVSITFDVFLAQPSTFFVRLCLLKLPHKPWANLYSIVFRHASTLLRSSRHITLQIYHRAIRIMIRMITTYHWTMRHHYYSKYYFKYHRSGCLLNTELGMLHRGWHNVLIRTWAEETCQNHGRVSRELKKNISRLWQQINFRIRYRQLGTRFTDDCRSGIGYLIWKYRISPPNEHNLKYWIS